MLKSLEELNFNIFDVSNKVGRENTLSLVSWRILDKLDVIEMVNEEKLACFLDKVYLKYNRDV